MSDLRPVTLITGASSGIGADLARVFARHGHDVMLVARRKDKLEALADEIVAQGHVRPIVLPLDLEHVDAGAAIDAALKANGAEPQYVVNNAGFGLVGAAHDLDRAEQLSMLDLNVRVLTDLSLRWLDALARHRGGILNVASVAGFFPGPGMAVYYATKAYVVSFSEALHAELAHRDIRVTALCPGPVVTGFQARAGLGGRNGPKLLLVESSEVAEAGYRGLMAGQRIVMPGFFNRVAVAMTRFAPRPRLLKAVHGHMTRRDRPPSGT